MKKSYKKALFIFRRDLRLHDNNGLHAALQKSDRVVPCFIVDPRQVSTHNEYRSLNALQFMTESLQDLENQFKKRNGKLSLFHGQAEVVLKKLLAQEKFDAVFCNKDYTPFSGARDAAMQEICQKHACAFESYSDALLNEPNQVLKADGKPYTIFTAFYNKARKNVVAKPHNFALSNFYTKSIKGSCSIEQLHTTLLPHTNNNIASHGGSAHGEKILTSLKAFEHYAHDRDYPAQQTTHLSAHLKFGTVSIRATYKALARTLGKEHPLIKQLYWRDFFTHVAFHTPSVFGSAYHAKYNALWWSNSTRHFDAWCNGLTGFPIVDAGMQELVTTGFMHNRVRMIVASFLVKDLHIDWCKGEKFFAQHLIDYDPAVNNGNWQWSASTGCDAQPYFRIFNPWLQQKKFDAECIYIKKWLPELATVSPKNIHAWFKGDDSTAVNYPKPIVDHAYEARVAKELFKQLQKKGT